MSKKTIQLPDLLIFSTTYDVLYSDVNSAGHMGADRVLPIAMEAQLRFIKRLGYTDAMAFEDAGLIMAHSEVQYLSEAGHGDKLRIRLGTHNFTDKSFELIYCIDNQTRGCEMARVVTTLLFFDYAETKVIRVPQSFLDRVQRLVHESAQNSVHSPDN